MSASSTAQLDSWTSSFGREYTDRNTLSLEQMDREAAEQLGTSKTAIYRAVLKDRLPAGRVLAKTSASRAVRHSGVLISG